MASVTLFVAHLDDGIDVKFTGKCVWFDYGIGSYEFWGAKGFDSNLGFGLDEDGAQWDKTIYNESQNEAISNFVTENDSTLDMLLTKDAQYLGEDGSD